MTVCPLRRSVGFKAATALSRVETSPMFVCSRPSRTRWTISLSWARSDSTTKSTAKPSAGRASAGPTTVTSVPPARIRPADRFWMSPLAAIGPGRGPRQFSRDESRRMNLNDDVVYGCLRFGLLHELHPGRSRSLVRYHDCFHGNCLLGHLSSWWKCCIDGRVSLTDVRG